MKKNKIIPKLSDLYKTSNEFGGIMSASNIDNMFIKIRCNGIDEVMVSWSEMLSIALFFIANADKIPIQEQEKTKWSAINIMREGRVDKYLGVKLRLIE